MTGPGRYYDGPPVIDLHAHVLPGLDDGPRTVAESLTLARAAVAAGTRVMVATPHVNERYTAAVNAVPGAVDALQAQFVREDIPLDLRPGAEIAMSRLGMLDDAALERLALGGGQWVLLEAPLRGPADVPRAVAAVRERGRGAVLAHAERCEALRREPAMLRQLVRDGALVSITADSLAGHFGEGVRRFALLLLREGLVHNVASDAHDAQRRPPGGAAGKRAADRAVPGASALWTWLTEEVPAAVLEGGSVPPPPRPPRGWRARLSRGA